MQHFVQGLDLFHQFVQVVIESQGREISDLNLFRLHEDASLLEALEIAPPAYAPVVLPSGLIQLNTHPNWLQVCRQLAVTLQLPTSASDGDGRHGPNKPNCATANVWWRRGQDDRSSGFGNAWRKKYV